jgi:2-oxoglutarate ferredoxin oxidoreductase subunit alpha
MGGGDAIGLGAVNGGLKMYVGYPMTPASSALHFLAAHAKDYGVFVKIPEDEISAICTAIGGNYAGVRAMTGSSGGGFSLMVEAVGLSGMLEVPLVIYEAQRAGPSTGLPTKTEQGDLNLVLGASQGDFLRIVLAPGNVKECFELTREAMNLAQKFQTPVFVMSDLYLAEHYESVDDLDFTFKLDDGLRPKDGQQDYKRYEFTKSGISPRAYPGQPGLMHNEDSDEHGETGDVVSDAVTDPKARIDIMEKRMRKFATYIGEMPPTKTYRYDDAEYAIVQWGSTRGAVEEAIDILRERGIRAGAVEVNRVFPLNPDVAGLLKGKKKIIVVEGNYTGQFNRLLRSELRVETSLVNKFDGEAFYPGALADELEVEIKR